MININISSLVVGASLPTNTNVAIACKLVTTSNDHPSLIHALYVKLNTFDKMVQLLLHHHPTVAQSTS